MTPASARFSGIGKSHVKCHPDSVPAFLFSINLSMPRPAGQRLSKPQNNQSVQICTGGRDREPPTAPEKPAAHLDCAGRAQRRRRFRPAECARTNGRSRSKAGSRCACPRSPKRWRVSMARHFIFLSRWLVPARLYSWDYFPVGLFFPVGRRVLQPH